MKKLSILCLTLFLTACDDPNVQQTAKKPKSGTGG